jgi:hypothetical protein
MGRKKKNEPERTCANCAYGPEGDRRDEDCDACDDMDGWSPKEQECNGDSCTVSVNGGPAVPFPSKEALGEMAKFVEGHTPEDPALPLIKKGLGLDDVAPRSTQLDLEGKPLPEPDVEDDDETEVREFTIYRSNGLVFRIGTETLGKALELKKKENVSDRKDRIKLLVQNRSKVISGLKPLDPNKWDAGTKAIYERIMAGHGKDV